MGRDDGDAPSVRTAPLAEEDSPQWNHKTPSRTESGAFRSSGDENYVGFHHGYRAFKGSRSGNLVDKLINYVLIQLMVDGQWIDWRDHLHESRVFCSQIYGSNICGQFGANKMFEDVFGAPFVPSKLIKIPFPFGHFWTVSVFEVCCPWLLPFMSLRAKEEDGDTWGWHRTAVNFRNSLLLRY